ncbi:MAG: hypothetical protein EBZ48_00785 [Proteobacteria bacterium]|nr:hypothetical protein [Pseudomonadota bacterium]
MQGFLLEKHPSREDSLSYCSCRPEALKKQSHKLSDICLSVVSLEPAIPIGFRLVISDPG